MILQEELGSKIDGRIAGGDHTALRQADFRGREGQAARFPGGIPAIGEGTAAEERKEEQPACQSGSGGICGTTWISGTSEKVGQAFLPVLLVPCKTNTGKNACATRETAARCLS